VLARCDRLQIKRFISWQLSASVLSMVKIAEQVMIGASEGVARL
jgi:hypothetical protein